MSEPAVTTGRSDFVRCALLSGLLTQQQLDDAAAALGNVDCGDDEDDGRRLAERVVQSGYLNAWQARQLLAGQTQFQLGPYRIVDALGHGGMGHVFRAEHDAMGRQVAIKVLPLERSTPEAIANFTREIRAQASLDHENLVRAYDAGHDRKVYYLVSEYVPGCDLRKLVQRRGPLDMATAAEIISDVALGLQHAHDRGLIHRDVKPGNVLVTPEGRAKLSDLGLAGSLDANADADPRRGKLVGTADYLSPDQIKAPWMPTPAWDIYSLGCTLYYAVTGKVPFPGGTAAQKARAHAELRPLDPRCHNRTLSVEFVDVIADMMAKDPDERIASAAEAVDRLSPWTSGVIPIPEAASADDSVESDDGELLETEESLSGVQQEDTVVDLRRWLHFVSDLRWPSARSVATLPRRLVAWLSAAGRRWRRSLGHSRWLGPVRRVFRGRIGRRNRESVPPRASAN